MNDTHRHVVMIASENDALAGGKVGGVADVIRDLSRAIAEKGWRVTTLVPSYGFLHTRSYAQPVADIEFPFAGKTEKARVLDVSPRRYHAGVKHLVIDHPLLAGQPIYYDDPPATPFRRDATKFACFCSAAGTFLHLMESVPVLHLHDWHSGFLMLLRNAHPAFAHLRHMRTAFTIHNIALQGTRPMRGDESSVESWFPELDASLLSSPDWIDDRYANPCFTPMLAGIRFADSVNTVSLGYAGEILQPNDPEAGFHGGEGLERHLHDVQKKGTLFGILNGCEYPRTVPLPRRSFADVASLIASEVVSLSTDHPDPDRIELLRRLDLYASAPPAFVMTMVTRVVEQKVSLMFAKGSDGSTCSERIGPLLAEKNGLLIVIGNGQKPLEEKFREMSRASERVLYLDGYYPDSAAALYANGDMFLMPSSFEPCGISQMLAMREGQPCIVHGVGGLKDTVIDGVNGFAFTGDSIPGKVDAFLLTLQKAVSMLLDRPREWNAIRDEAARARFTWEQSARDYIDNMYAPR
jgi:starch synthase